MFADACQKVAEFVRPVVVSIRQYDGQVKTQCGTFMVLNRDGWIVTAGHIYDSFMKYQTDQNKLKEIRELNESRSTRPGAPSMEVKPDPTYITNHNSARSLICKIDRDELLQVLVKSYLEL